MLNLPTHAVVSESEGRRASRAKAVKTMVRANGSSRAKGSQRRRRRPCRYQSDCTSRSRWRRPLFLELRLHLPAHATVSVRSSTGMVEDECNKGARRASRHRCCRRPTRLPSLGKRHVVCRRPCRDDGRDLHTLHRCATVSVWSNGLWSHSVVRRRGRRTVTVAEESGTETASVGHFVAQSFKGGLPRLGRAPVSLGTSSDGLHDRRETRGSRKRERQTQGTSRRTWDVWATKRRRRRAAHGRAVGAQSAWGKWGPLRVAVGRSGGRARRMKRVGM